MIVPRSHPASLEFNVEGLSKKDYNHEIQYAIKLLLARIFEKEIKLETTLDELKRHLIQKCGLNFNGLFDVIDVYGDEGLDPDK
jgi:hypothetical protein